MSDLVLSKLPGIDLPVIGARHLARLRDGLLLAVTIVVASMLVDGLVERISTALCDMVV